MRVVALTFHEFTANGSGDERQGDAFYRVSAVELESLLSHLRRLGFRTVSSRAFRAWQQGRGTIPERTVVLTFDDGYATHLTVAASTLIRHRFTGTFFVNPARIGRPGYLTWDQVRTLVFLGMEVGSHGLTHRPLTQLAPEELTRELKDSRRVLEERLGVAIGALAVPGGFWNAAVARAAREAGYDAVWVSTIGTNGRETNPLALRRVVVRRPVAVERVVSMVEGWQPAFWWATSQQRLIRLLKRALGVYWYEQLKRRLVPNA
jgi:peptidoglycan/xylan/chitin deacetylase (PgdA/CDA1 family)